ncbi:MAG: ArsR/SmtB family transcription factor [Candidatus Binataceae bacterium]
MPRTHTAGAKLARTGQVFAALGDETRLRIVERLSKEGPVSIVGLTEGTKISRQAITKHLHALEEAGLARSSRAGRERIWELQTKRLAEARRHLDQISQQWDAAIGRLRAFVERQE